MKNIIKTIIRDENKQPRGIAVAVKNNNKIDYGFSLINPKADRWNKALGTEIAVYRALADSYQLPAVKEREKAVLDAFEKLEVLSIKYFKDMDYEDIALRGHFGFEDVNA
jgi:hypothetical protein